MQVRRCWQALYFISWPLHAPLSGPDASEIRISDHVLLTPLLTLSEPLRGWLWLGPGHPLKVMLVGAGLFAWRDAKGRQEDESTGYVLPNKLLHALAKSEPRTAAELAQVLPR